MSMYDRFARDASESLFNSIYGELYQLASAQQAAIYKGCKKHRKGRAPTDYYVGEHQDALNAFCHNRLSIGEALDHLRIARVYH